MFNHDDESVNIKELIKQKDRGLRAKMNPIDDYCSLETFWNELGDIPVDDDGIIQESFLWWPKGTDREDIWHWFDEKYPGGVVTLLGSKMQNVIDKFCEIGYPGPILTRKELEQLLEDQ